MFSEGYSLADIAAATGNGNNSNSGWGDWGMWIWVILIFAIFGWGNSGFGGGFGGSGSQGAATNYVLASDFATLQRQIDSGFAGQERKLDSITNGLCDGFYTQAQLINGVNMNIAQNGYESRLATQTLGSQLQNCCCDVRQQIGDVNYNIANQASGLGRQVERGFADTNYAMATQNCATLQAIDKVGDRVIDYLANKENQNLRDENFALRLAASQEKQNNYLVAQLGDKCPIPAYLTCNPNAPLNYGVTYGNSCCGCNS